MKTVIIHRKERTDRIRNVAKLLELFPGAVVEDAVVPSWVERPIDRAMRGCTLSHLNSIRKHLTNEPLLVLEDDAVVIPEHLAAFPEVLPDDALAVIVGGDVDQFAEREAGGFRRVLPKFFGTHAVVYLPKIWRTPFLLNAFAITAESRIGHEGVGNICFESMLLTAAAMSGAHFYRPHKMCFTTLGDVSDTFNTQSEKRNKALVAEDRPGLLPESEFAEIFEPYAGKTVYLEDSIPGNHGDQIINAATRQLFDYFGLSETRDPAVAEVMFYPGGGNICGNYDFKQTNDFFDRAAGKETVVLPQTWGAPDRHGDKITRAFVREETSLHFRPDAIVVPDLALAYRTSLVGDHNLPGSVFMRDDAERMLRFPNSAGDPVRMARDHYDYLRLAGMHGHIHTDRLHFAIAGLIMGTHVTLYPNAYHKNKSVYDHSLRHLGCRWQQQ